MATNAQVVEFINTMAPLVIAECNRRAAAGMGFVIPSVCIAQAAHETGWGTSSRMKKSNAYFGIKAGGSWTGKVFSAETWEVVDGVTHNITANFRAYDSLADSVKDYYDLILNARYVKALSFLDRRLTPEATIQALFEGGYATDPPYPSLIMNLLNGRDLDQYDDKITGIADDSTGGSGIVPGGSEYVPPTEFEDTRDVVKFIFEKIK